MDVCSYLYGYLSFYINCFLILLSIIYIFSNSLRFNNTSENNNSKIFDRKSSKYFKRKGSNNQEKYLRYYSYNIFMDNLSEFFSSKNLFLIPGKNCPNKNMQTFFFKQKHSNTSYKYNKFQNKNLFLKANDNSKSQPTAYYYGLITIRELFLDILGFKLDYKLGIYDLYLAPYNIKKKFKTKIHDFINDKYQKISKFFNNEEFSYKSLFYLNYKRFEKRYHSEYDYMLVYIS